MIVKDTVGPLERNDAEITEIKLYLNHIYKEQ